MGNRVVMWELEGTELTALEWLRPGEGLERGFRVLDAGELMHVARAVEEATAGLRAAPLVDDLDDAPLDLQAFLDELLDR